MKYLLTTVFLLSLNFGFGHDIKMAIFEIFEGESGLEISISIDRDNFNEAIKNEYSDLHHQNEFEDMAWEYIDSNMKIYINGQFASFEITEIKNGKNNIHISGTLNTRVDELREVRMTNTLMIDMIDGHDNIMKLNLNEKNRSFRLNEGRTSTVATY